MGATAASSAGIAGQRAAAWRSSPRARASTTRLGTTPAPGLFGTAGFISFDFRPQLLTIPHLRNLYQKVGMFGHAPNPGLIPGNNGFLGDQVRGFGFPHDGAIDTIFRFHQAIPFSSAGGSTGCQ